MNSYRKVNIKKSLREVRRIINKRLRYEIQEEVDKAISYDIVIILFNLLDEQINKEKNE